jgi:hypothetical protein
MADHVLNPINFVTGTLGSGKSYYATRQVFRYLAAGKTVALNYDLVPYVARNKKGERDPSHPYEAAPWWRTAHEMSKKRLAPAESPTDRWRWILGCMDRCWRFEDQEDLYDFRLPGDPDKEDRGLLVIDEGALRMNSRMWNERGAKNAKKGHHKLRDLEFMLHVRKLGWTMLLLTQGFKMIDNQYRELGPVEIRLRNLNKINIPLLNVPFSSKPRFIAIHYMAEAKLITKREYYGIGLAAGHYKSNALFSPDDERDTGLLRMSQAPTGMWHAHPDDEALATEAPARGPLDVRRGAAVDTPAAATSPARAKATSGEAPSSRAVLVAPPETVMEHSNHIHYKSRNGG